MKQLIRMPHIVLAIAAFSFLVSCQKEDQSTLVDQSANESAVVKSQGDKVFYGPTVPVGNGVARAWVAQDEDGNPTAVGVTLSEKALQRLPSEGTAYVLDFPKQGATDFYTHVLMDWNPNGHDPIPIYGVPHFDFHFYTIPNEQRLLIGPDDTIQFANAPLPQYVPSGYWQAPGGVPQMGSHWLDMQAPEFNGGSFTRTFIWGSYDGEFIFWEPMITTAYLMTQPDETIPVRQPEAYARDGWYANNYKVIYSTKPNEYNIILSDLQFHQGN